MGPERGKSQSFADGWLLRSGSANELPFSESSGKSVGFEFSLIATEEFGNMFVRLFWIESGVVKGSCLLRLCNYYILGSIMLSVLILGCIEPWSDIFAMPFPISCCIPVFDLQLVPEQAGLSQVFPSQTLLPQVSGVHVVETIDILPSDIDMVASGTDIDASDNDASDIVISDIIDCVAIPDAIVSCLPEILPNAATDAPRTKTLATPNHTF